MVTSGITVVNKMAKLSSDELALFPLKNIDSVVKLFKIHIEKNHEPNLAILSIILGYIENTLTCSRVAESSDSVPHVTACDKEVHWQENNSTKIPAVEYTFVEALYQRFLSIIKAHVDVASFGNPKYASRELVKRVSDVVWCTLSSSYYKDRAHLQSIYSYMTGAKLDSSGTTLAVVAACQALGYNDVHLALSEDHTWVVCGANQQTSVEVTWHGKGNEDKRGIPVTFNVYDKSWLYVNGRPVICDRYMEVASMISSMNPGISASTDSEEVLILQQALLWLMYDANHIAKYPMAIANLGDLEETAPSLGRPSPISLYQEAIVSNVTHYSNHHVYPYTCLAGYCYRNALYKQALQAWAKAAAVIKHYNYSRDDEEIYKEFLDIANELIPHIMRVVSSGIEAHSILKDPECFALLLQFYDGICLWEEGSATPVLHIGWAKCLVNTMAKFDAEVRSRLKITCGHDDSGDENGTDDEEHCKGRRHSPAHPQQDQNGNTQSGLAVAPHVELNSAKMRGLRHLLLADKLNSQAVSLQLTAQSQVKVRQKRSSAAATSQGPAELENSSNRPKRGRRD
ncbi:menin [Hyalella azteca]|uniref:Menin n=1 Tax=Hyalella azteca TaxID=294128 RepID=A0A8B7MZY0_HYAAZ|nr:menin [Hyalella azteca]